MPILQTLLLRGQRDDSVAALHRAFEILGFTVESAERDRRHFGAATEALIREFQKEVALPITGVFDEATRAAITAALCAVGPFSVSGRVLDAGGEPVVGATVFAVDVDLRRSQMLGQAPTDRDGEYEIRYAADKFTRAEKDRADLMVRVRLGDDRIAESEVVFNAPAEVRIDLVFAGRHGPSEYERLEAALGPLLDGTLMSELTDEDVGFLAGETGRAPALWRAFVQAQRLVTALAKSPVQQRPDGTPESAPIPAAAFYGWLRGGLAADWDSLCRVPVDLLRVKLAFASASKLIPAWSDDEIAEMVARIPNAAHASVRELLDLTVPAETARRVGAVIGALDAVDDALLARLVHAKVIAPGEAERVGLAVSLHRLAGASPAATAALLDTEFSGVHTGKLQHARDLVAVEPAEWERVLEKAGAAQPDGVSRAAQARGLAMRVAAAYPEDAFRRQVVRVAPAGGRASARVERMEAVLARNPNVSFLDLDYLPDSVGLARVDFGDLSGDARAQAIADLKAHQRVHAVTGNAIAAADLLRAGFTSASAIALRPAAALAQRAGLAPEEAAPYHARAVELANIAALNWLAIHDVVRDARTAAVRAIPSPEEFFRSLVGYAGLVNDQPWCECADCQSVLSPAAYFVDLMFFIEEHILKDSFQGRETHPLHLAKRRPDLWHLELTCANTNDLVPSLALVNEILEGFLQDAGAFADAPAIYRQLALEDASIKQPFTLPLERLQILLEHFNLTRFDVATAMGVPPGTRARARLGISLQDHELITTERFANPAYLLAVFRLTSTVTAPDDALAAVEMATVVRALDLPHDTVAAILVTSFVGVDGSTQPAIAITLGKRDPQDVQNNSEIVTNLTLRRLDRIHRFVRLWRTLPWTVDELDYVLARLSAPGNAAAITAATLERVLDLLVVGAGWQLAVDELLALSDDFPARVLREPVPLFDRLFNQAAFVDRDGSWNAATSFRFTHPSWTARLVTGQPPAPVGRPTPADNTLMRLLGGLQLTDGDFVELVAHLRTLPAIDHRPATATDDESIALSPASIGALYRHARLRRLLGRTIAELFQLLALAGTPSGFVETLADVRAVMEIAAWQKQSGFNLDRIEYLLDPARAGELDPSATAAALVANTAAERSLEFADTLFAPLGLTEAQSRKLVADNLTRQPADALPFEPTSGGYRVRAIGLGGLVAPAALAPQILALLDARSPLHVARVALGTMLGRTLEEVAVLQAVADPLDAAATAAIARAMQGSTAPADFDRLTSFVARVCRFHTLFGNPVFDRAELEFVAAQPAVFFGGGLVAPLVATPAIDLDVVRNVASYAALAAPTDAGFTTASGPADLAALRRVVVDVAAATDADLARALRAGEAQIAALRPHLTLPAGTFGALSVLAQCVTLAARLGVSGETFSRMFDETSPAAAYDGLARAAEDVFGGFRAKHPDATTFAAKLEPFEDKLRTRKRDGLVDYILTRWPTPFVDPSKLYEHFLVDVSVQGCARTSRVVAATSSLQLYVHRVLMNLERSADWDPSAPANPGVWARFFDANKRREWQWRQHFRVWEANRRVFLYPENYLEPELRDDKTPLFDELEDTLLMQEIDKASVHDAYSRYITGFDEVARLKIAGAYHDPETRVLHLFGVTQDDAPSYYYRQVDDSGWEPEGPPIAPQFSAWHKLMLQIPVRTVSPIVFEGRLYVFWIETMTRPMNAFQGGTSRFDGYRHTVRVKFSMLRPDGAWTAPQVARFAEGGGIGDSRIVEDPRDETKVNEMKAELAAKRAEVPNREAVIAVATQTVQIIEPQAALATQIRQNAQAVYDAGLTPAESFAVGLATAAGGLPAGIAAAQGFLDGKLNALKAAKQLEAQMLEALAIAKDAQHAAEEALRVLNEQIAQLQASIAAAKIMVRWDASQRDHTNALDNYKPEGWQWDRVYPEVYYGDVEPTLRVTLVPKADRMPVPRSKPEDVPAPNTFDVSEGLLREQAPPESPTLQPWPLLRWSSGTLTIDTPSFFAHPGQTFYGAAHGLDEGGASGPTVATGPVAARVQIVNGLTSSAIIESQGDSVWMHRVGGYAGTRLGTSLTRALSRQFWRDGADSLLDPGFQDGLIEVRSKISPIAGQDEPARQSPFHPDHAYLTYFRETFFHIPFLIADHLNGESQFAEAQRWYHHVFDPTSGQDAPWRYREFREPSKLTQTLRDLLTDREALAAYRRNPFSPHAIARTRMTAYQKAIVMKYVDNLLDWGDSLFNQFTMESLNEATMLYVMAQDILGPRPAVLGACGEATGAPRTYQAIRPGLGEVSDFLVELEASPTVRAMPPRGGPTRFVIPRDEVARARPTTARSSGTPADFRRKRSATMSWTGNTGVALASLRDRPTLAPAILGNAPRGSSAERPAVVDVPAPVGIGVAGGRPIVPFAEVRPPSTALVEGNSDDLDAPAPFVLDLIPRKEAVFCIPPNRDLLAYWDRVEDRLFKIRNCKDITGARRQLDLFAPELDPRLLVRMTAAGLSIDDVLNATSGNLPPYRFTYLIERAKQHASTVQSLGAQLLSAFEKADAEELSHLRAVHDQNLLVLRTRTTQLEIDAAEDALESLRRQKAAVEYRRDHYLRLRDVGQLPGERKQQQLQGTASGYRTAAGVAQIVASILTIIPDSGAPTAMKFGGSQLGAAGRAVAEGLNAIAAYNEMAAARTGVEASNQRRDEEWQHQVETAKRELIQIEKNITAAEIRRDIADRALVIHNQSVVQTEEIFSFFREKFSSVDRYRLLSRELRRLYRLAFNSALTLARMAEQAYRAERPGDDTLLTGDYWDAQGAGLLAGERLSSDLLRLERQFMERNYRELEVEHSFSLAQFAPDGLADLRLTGECHFEIPEWFFDLTYPGQYRRRLKAVRVTIPCVTGPHANIGATLRLDGSQIRGPQPSSPLTSVPLRHTVSIATSKAQNDAGVFDFSFRDERYMPFEGAGAISSWTLSLPKTLRTFNYDTISDVILELDYTAEYDEGLKQRWDDVATELLKLLATQDPASPPLVRTFRLRTDFPDTFNRLVHDPAGTAVGFELDARHFPGFTAGRGRTLEATSASLQIITPARALPATHLAIGPKAATPPQAFRQVAAPAAPTKDGGALCMFDLGDVLESPLTEGGVAKALIGAYVIKLATGIDPRQLGDIVLRVGYRIVP